jgi:prepilin signal peptidase PulO-like enzyme (type II secretory pathway)
MELYFLIWAGLIGLVIGSFLNCLIWRLYKDESLLGRSYCPHCRRTIAWYDNIPLLSFALLGGHCRHCRARISWQYPLVELATAILFMLTWQLDLATVDFSWRLLRDWLLVSTLIIIFVYDSRWQLVPLPVIWSMGVVIFVLNLFLGFSWIVLLLFAAVGAAFFLIQYVLTAKRGVGEGDIWLGGLLGLAFPSAGPLLLIMLVAYIIGAAIGLGLIAVRKKDWQSRIALAPFLVIGALTALIWGDQIISWYLGLF